MIFNNTQTKIDYFIDFRENIVYKEGSCILKTDKNTETGISKVIIAAVVAAVVFVAGLVAIVVKYRKK